MLSIPTDAATRPTPRARQAAPLAWPAIGLTAGILLDRALPLPPWAFVALAGVSAGLWWRARRVDAAPSPRAGATNDDGDRRRQLAARALRFSALGLASLALGAQRHALADRHWPIHHVARWVSGEPTLATLRGRVADEPRVLRPSRDPALRAYPSEPRTSFTLAVESWIDMADRPHRACGRVRVSVTGEITHIDLADVVEVFGFVSAIVGPANPGTFDWQQSMRLNNIRVRLSADAAEAVRLVRGASSATIDRALQAARRKLSGVLRDAGGGDDMEAGSVLDALVLAQRSGVDRSIEEAFRRTGLTHLLAASGLNVGWVALLMAVAAWLVGWHYRVVALLTLLAVGTYCIVAEANPPILRAGLMAGLGCLAWLRRVRWNSFNWLAASALVLLLANPNLLFGVSFQLTFVVLLGLLTLTRPIDTAVEAGWRRVTRTAGRADLGLTPPFPVGAWVMPQRGRYGALVRGIHISSLWSLSAWLAALPLVIRHFGAVPPWGFVNSLFVAPLAGLVMMAGCVKLLAAALWSGTLAVTGPALSALTTLLNGVVQTLARIPGTSIEVYQPGWSWVAACYAALIGWVSLRRRPRARRSAIAAFGLLCIWPFVPPRWWMQPRDRIIVWSLAVGDGLASVIELPDGRVLLYDCGARAPRDVGGRLVSDFLHWRGVASIDAAFVSHPDLDHFSGIEALARRIPIRRLVLNAHFADFGSNQRAVQSFLATVGELGIPIETISAGWTLSPDGGPSGAAVECIWPPPAGAFITNDNSSSTVLRVSFGGRSMLLTGDIDRYAIDQLLAQGQAACDVLLLPHHGGMTGVTGTFVDATGASIFVRSSGQPDRETTNGLLRLMTGRAYFNTADDGCVRVDLSSAGVTVATHRPRGRSGRP